MIYEIKIIEPYNCTIIEMGQDSYEKISNCDICGNSVNPLLQSINSNQNVYGEISICKNCLHIMRTNRLKDSVLDNYYQNTWDTLGNNVKIKKELNPLSYNRVSKFLKSNSRVLEIGVGYGESLAYFQKMGCDVIGIEASEIRQKTAKDWYNLNIENLPIEKFEHVGFDVIYSNHVFEHLKSPKNVVKKLFHKLNENGILMITVPDVFNEFPIFALNFVPHLHYFSNYSLVQLFITNGLEVLEVRSEGGELIIIGQKSFSGNLANKFDDRENKLAKIIQHWTLTRIDEFYSVLYKDKGFEHLFVNYKNFNWHLTKWIRDFFPRRFWKKMNFRYFVPKRWVFKLKYIENSKIEDSLVKFKFDSIHVPIMIK